MSSQAHTAVATSRAGRRAQPHERARHTSGRPAHELLGARPRAVIDAADALVDEQMTAAGPATATNRRVSAASMSSDATRRG